METKETKWITKYTFIAPVVVLALLVLVFKVKEIYPFGQNTICYRDFIQCYAINYKFFIDTLRSFDLSKFFYVDTVLGGNGIFATMTVTGIFSIFSPLYLLCNDTNNIMNFMSYMFVFRIILATITMYYSLKRIYSKSNEFINVILSIIWGLSNYILLNYTTIIWLDVMIIFPIFIVALKNILDNKKINMYVIVLALLTITSFQLTYMILFFVVIAVAIGLIFYVKQDRKKVVFKLGIATLCGLLLSSVVFLPTIRIYLSSYRNTISSMIISYDGAFYIKLIHILLYSIVFFGTVCSLKYIKNDNKIASLAILIAFIGLIPIMYDQINKLWHGGGYFCFPFRQGFIVLYLMLVLTGYYFNNYFNKEDNKILGYKKVLLIILAIIIFIISCYFNYLFVIESINISLVYKGMTALVAAYIFLYCFLRFIVYLIISKVNNDAFKMVVIITLIIEALFACYSMIGKTESNEQVAVFYQGIEIAKEIKEKIPDISEDAKISDLDGSLYTNLGLYTGLNSSSGWILADKSTSKFHDYFYFDEDHVKLKSNEYAVLSDYIINAQYVITENDLDGIYSALYTKMFTLSNGKYLYKYNYEINHAFKYDSSIDISRLPEKKSLLDSYDYFYSAIFGKDNFEQLIENNDINIEKFLEYVNSNKIDTIEFNKSGDVYNYKVNSNGNESLIIPMHYSKNWIITNNGKQIKYDRVLEDFISIKLENGENNIELKYFDPWIIYGLVISIISIILLFLFNKYESKLFNNKKAMIYAYASFMTLTAIVVLFIIGYGFGSELLELFNDFMTSL